MCSVSMVTDDWHKKQWPNIFPDTYPWNDASPISREEFNQLKAELENLKEELKKARQKDIEDEAPLCVHKVSVDLVKQLAEILGVNLEDVFDGHEKS